MVIGSSASSDDISRDIAKFAKEVHVASRSAQIENIGKMLGHDNIWLHTMVKFNLSALSLCSKECSTLC